MTDLATLETGWNQAAREDAMFNIITLPQYANGGWEAREFFQHGRREVDAILGRLDELGLHNRGKAKALDFGCGIGRLTQALIPEYKKVWGVDISGEMVRLARRHNRWESRCTYIRIDEHVIPYIHAGSCDLVYSNITLQHMPQVLQQGYVTEFFRLLKPDGVAMFVIPEGPYMGHPSSWLSMYGVRRATVEEWVADAGGTLVDVESTGQDSRWQNYRYTAVMA